jgi:HPt (histidine-containing phosphotransfer) domain-containing protein
MVEYSSPLLDAILGMSSMLMLSGLNEDQLRCARTIDSSARLLLARLNRRPASSKPGAPPLDQIPCAPVTPGNAAPPPVPPPRPLRLLIAEDDALNRVIAPIPPPEGGGAGLPIDVSLLAALARSRSVDGQNLLDRMIGLFTESGPQMLDQMDQALRKDDYEAAVRAVHKLAGGCTYFGAGALYTLCAHFERLGHPVDPAALRALSPRIRLEYARVDLALQRHHP